LNAKILIETLKALPTQPITLEFVEEQRSVEITSAYGKYRVACNDPALFPKMPKPQGVERIRVKGDFILRAINYTIFATSNDEVRPAMMGVLFEIQKNCINFVATDAHKLVKYTVFEKDGEAEGRFILSKKSVALVKNAIDANSNISVGFNASFVFFESENTVVACRLMDATYPDYSVVIPQNNPNILVINRLDFLNSLKRIFIYSNKSTYQAILNIVEDSMSIAGQDNDFSNEAAEQLACQFNGEPMIMGFNSKFLIEMLGVMDTEEVKFELGLPNRAGLLFPGEQGSGEHLLMLVMPVMIPQPEVSTAEEGDE